MANKESPLLEDQLLAKLDSFVIQNLHTDITQLAFKKELVKGLENRFVLEQLYGKQKAKSKLPFLFEQSTILYPVKVSVEQSTSQLVATWKSSLVEGESMLDMTGGFGIDSYHFAQKVKQLTYIEQQTPLFKIVQHNYQELGVNNITCHNTNAVDFLSTTTQTFDWIYLDPARRDEAGNRKIGLAGYTPNMMEIKKLLLTKSENILLKTSPMLDIKQAVQQLESVASIYVVGLQNEVKELLFVLSKEVPPTIKFHCVNLKKDSTNSTYIPTASLGKEVSYELPKKYLYEPNSTILKAGLFQEIALDFGLHKLHPNTHLYTSDTIHPNFPGRVFTCEAVAPYQAKQLRKYLSSQQANITTRNFPYTVAQMRKKLKLSEGGEQYLFGATLLDGGLKVLVCRKWRDRE